MMNDDERERMADLESRLAFQDDAQQKLSDALVEQQARLDQLEATVKMLIDRARQQGLDDLDVSEEQPPPHY